MTAATQADRVVPMDGARLESAGALIASKKNSEVFAFGDKQVLKLYRDHVPAESVQRESRICGLISQAGLPSPRIEPGTVRTEDGREGIVLERAQGQPLSELFHAQPGRLRSWSRLIAGVHSRMHEHPPIAGLPSQRERAAEEIAAASKLSLATRKRLLRLLESMPEGSERSVCHADLHPSNIMVGQGHPVVIDWGGATNGSSMCDVARTWILLRYPVVNKSSYGMLFVRVYCMARASLYLHHYKAASSFDRAEFRRWVVINAATRLRDNLTPEVTRTLLARIRKDLKKLA